MAELDHETSGELLENFDPIPTEWYDLMITQSDVKPTSDGSGTILALQITVLTGDYAGRKVFDNINLRNANPKAVEIGKKKLNSIAKAVGIPEGTRISDSVMLHDKPFKGHVGIRAAGPDKKGIQREASNIMKEYEPAGFDPKKAPSAPQATTQPPRPPAMAGAGAGAGSSSAKMPWQK